MSIESVRTPNYLSLCRLLLLPSVFPSIGWPKYWSFSLCTSPSNEYSGLISFRMDWLDLLSVQGALQDVFQHDSLKASILQSSAFFMVQLSHPHMTTEKTIQNFIGKVISVLFNMLSRLVTAFLSRSKCLNFMAPITICSDFGAQENKVCHCFHIYLS